MNLDRLFNIAASIVTLAAITVVITSTQTANIIRQAGRSFSGALRAATGR